MLDVPTEMKIFFSDSGPEDKYAEIYINIDTKRGVLQFYEKDPDYRVPLLRALSEGS